VSVVIVGVIRRKPVLTHASIVCEGMLASVNSVNSVNLLTTDNLESSRCPLKPRPVSACVWRAKSSKMASDSSDCFRYNFALVSRIANAFATSSSFDLKKGVTLDIDKARREHEELVEALRRIGLDVIELPSDEKHPDGLFVDDIAVVIHGTALICNPPTFNDRPTRQGEVSSTHCVAVTLSRRRHNVHVGK